jgi:hypothetical protein
MDLMISTPRLAILLWIATPIVGQSQQLSGPIDYTSANVTFNGYGDNSQVGRTVASIGDFNGDGYDDVVIGSPYFDVNGVSGVGSAFLLYGGPQGANEQKLVEPENADVWLHGNADKRWVGYTVAGAGDLNGDGLDDVLLGNWPLGIAVTSNSQKVYLVYGRSGSESLSGAFDIDSADAVFQFTGNDLDGGVDPLDQTGFGINRVGDLDGDGHDDLMIGANWARTDGGRNAGATYLFYGDPENPFSGDIDVSTADAVLIGTNLNDNSGWAIAPELDFDGDGRNDLLITATGNGTSYLFYGDAAAPRMTGEISLADADLKISGGGIGDFTGESVTAGDFNGDGTDDLVIGAGRADIEGLINAGKAYIILGVRGDDRREGQFNLSDADLIVSGDREGVATGNAVASAGDVNGDGLDDLLVSAPYADPPGTVNAGETHLIYGRMDPAFYNGVLNLSETDAVFLGNWYSLSGSAVSSAGDFNGDGLDDFLIGAPRDGLGTEGGAAYIVFGRPVPEPSSAAVAIGMFALTLAITSSRAGSAGGRERLLRATATNAINFPPLNA